MKYYLIVFAAIILDVMPLGCDSCRNRHGSSPDYLSVSESSVSFEENGGSMNIIVRSNTGWSTSVNQDWLTIVPMQGKMDGDILVTAAPNTEQNSRYGKLIITTGDELTKGKFQWSVQSQNRMMETIWYAC